MRHLIYLDRFIVKPPFSSSMLQLKQDRLHSGLSTPCMSAIAAALVGRYELMNLHPRNKHSTAWMTAIASERAALHNA